MGLRSYSGPVPTFPDRRQWTWQHVLQTRAESHGDKVFLRSPEEGLQFSYRETLGLATRIAGKLFSLGAQPGDRILIMAANSADCLLAGTSCIISGLVEVPINCEYKGAILEHQVGVVKPRFGIVDAEFVERFSTRAEFETIEHFLVIGGDDDRRRAQQRLAELGWPSTPFDRAKEAPSGELPAVRYSDLCHIMFTSGTTGPSKGVRMPQAQSYLFAEEDLSLVRLTDSDIRMTAFPLFHGQAKFLSVLSAILAGAELVLYQRFSATAWLERVQESRATVTNFVSGAMSMVWKTPPTARDRDNNLRCIFAAPTVPELVDGFKARFDVETITEGYGQTEITLPILTPYGEDRPQGAAGLAVTDWFDIRVANSETDEEVPPNSLGELLVRPKAPWTLNAGYEGMEGKTLDAWRNLWFHTGDAVRMDENGWVFFVDRVKDYLRRRGENISSFEVERALLEHPGVAECAVVGVRSEVAGGEDEVMAVVVASPEGITPEEVWAWSDERLPRFMVPQFVRIVGELPKSAANRVQKHKLREAGAAGAGEPGNGFGHTGREVENMSIAITEAHLELEGVARSFLAAHKARAAARSLLDAGEEQLPPFWRDMAELGWLGLHVAEEYGGSGFGLEELVVVVEALGRAVAPGPFLPTVIASALIADVGSDAQRERFLPALTDGTSRAGLGLGGSLHLTGDGWLSGDGGAVFGAGLGDLLVVAAGPDMVIVERSQPGVTISIPPNFDPTRRSGTVEIEATRIDEIAVLRGARPRAVALARTLSSAEACGGAHECVEMATGYAKVREQFGRVIGTFQAVKHHCANMLVAAELATAATWDAARAARSAPEQFELASAIAAVEALPAFLLNARLNIQVHGGIGFTWEHDAHLLLRRSAALVAVLGGSAADDVARLTSGGVTRELGIDLPPEAEATRREVRSFTAGLMSVSSSERLDRMIDAGYMQPHWPRPWGREAQAVEQLVIDEELTAAGIERPDYGVAPWIVLTIINHGTPEQIERWVRPTLQTDLVWCQLFSEPNAGSDAAAIRTSTTRVEGGWIVSGQKVWTSFAHTAHFGLATVRTESDGPKHAGITTMVIDMQASGVEVRPLREATGKAVFNEVFFDDVFVPDDDVIGPANGGWKIARSVFANERHSIGDRFGELSPTEPIDLVGLYRCQGQGHPAATRDFGRLVAEAHTLRLLNLRRVERAVAGGEPGPEANVTKLVRAEHEQRVANLALELDGADVLLAVGAGAQIGEALIFNCALTIGGGTSEITRNQIGERILGLPRDPLLR